MPIKFTKKIIIVPCALVTIIFFMSGAGQFLGLKPPVGIQDASGENRYGILGQTAPELNLTTWIDGNGKAMDPIRLSNFQGKVIYLYFFQAW